MLIRACVGPLLFSFPAPPPSTFAVRHRSDYQAATLNQDRVIKNQTKGSAKQTKKTAISAENENFKPHLNRKNKS